MEEEEGSINADQLQSRNKKTVLKLTSFSLGTRRQYGG